LIGYTSDQFELPLPVGHRFPMAKYRLLRERISDSAAQLGVQLREAPWADDEAVLRVHTPDYVAKAFKTANIWTYYSAIWPMRRRVRDPMQ